MHFWIHIEFTKILSQFKQKKIVDLSMKCYFKFFLFYTANLIFVNYKKEIEYIINKLQDHLFIHTIGIDFAKENVC
jgi:hypothetical protein